VDRFSPEQEEPRVEGSTHCPAGECKAIGPEGSVTKDLDVGAVCHPAGHQQVEGPLRPTVRDPNSDVLLFAGGGGQSSPAKGRMTDTIPVVCRVDIAARTNGASMPTGSKRQRWLELLFGLTTGQSRRLCYVQ